MTHSAVRVKKWFDNENIKNIPHLGGVSPLNFFRKINISSYCIYRQIHYPMILTPTVYTNITKMASSHLGPSCFQHFLFSIEYAVPRVMITFSQEELVDIEAQCQDYLLRFQRAAKDNALSR